MAFGPNSFGVTLTGDWAKAMQLLSSAPRRVERAVDKALLKEAHFIRRQIVVGIRSQAPGGRRFKALAPATIAKKGSSKALIDTGTLVGSISVRKTSRGVFVGVLRSARDRRGRTLANIAAIHEFGTRDGHVPARPFMQPVEDQFGPGAPGRMMRDIARELAGDFGRL